MPTFDHGSTRTLGGETTLYDLVMAISEAIMQNEAGAMSDLGTLVAQLAYGIAGRAYGLDAPIEAFGLDPQDWEGYLTVSLRSDDLD